MEGEQGGKVLQRYQFGSDKATGLGSGRSILNNQHRRLSLNWHQVAQEMFADYPPPHRSLLRERLSRNLDWMRDKVGERAQGIDSHQWRQPLSGWNRQRQMWDTIPVSSSFEPTWHTLKNNKKGISECTFPSCFFLWLGPGVSEPDSGAYTSYLLRDTIVRGKTHWIPQNSWRNGGCLFLK